MKSNDKKISISTRKNKNSTVIQIRRLPVARYGDKKISTGDDATDENIQKYIDGGIDEWNRLTIGKDITFCKFAIHAVESFNNDVSQTTRRDRENHLHNYICPYFKKLYFDQFDSDFIEAWQSKIKNQKGADYASRVKELLKRILTRAVKKNVASANVAIGTKPIARDDGKLREIYSKEEINMMLSNSTGWLRVFIIVRVFLGLRSNEVIGLKWSNIDFIRGTVLIEIGIRWGKFSEPKGGKRIVDIPKTALDALKEHKKEAVNDWVFITKRYQSYWSDCSYINSRHFQPFLKTLGIRYKSFYSLRHSYATYSLAEGQPLAYVSHNMGHKKTTTTTDAYIKYVQGVGGAEKTDEIFKL